MNGGHADLAGCRRDAQHRAGRFAVAYRARQVMCRG
jgi:hypothetical protein